MASQELKQIWEALKKVSDKQEEYKKLYLKNQEQDTAASNCFAGTIDVQGKHLEEVSEMISSIEVTVRELAHKVSINERRVDDLEQYSRSNCLILLFQHSQEIINLIRHWEPNLGFILLALPPFTRTWISQV